MEGRRVRIGRGRGRGRARPLLLPQALPPSPSSSSSSSSGCGFGTSCCCYLQFKMRCLNQALFRIGRRHAGFLRPWFSVGVGFGLTTLLAVSMILVWELGRALRILPESQSDTIWTASLLGFWPYNNSYSSSFSNSPVADAASLLLSTLISISFHEFGHALAAASEGIEMDYIAIFILLVFPGAFVAFNFDLLQALPHFASLRLYCAGIWHNAVCCAVCGLALLLLPLFLFPFYQHVQNPMVLALPSSSPLSGHLSPGDVIVSLDGATINTAQEWMDTAALINQMALDLMNSSRVKSIARVTSRKGYCIPDSVLEESKKIQLVENHSGCPYDLAAFATIPCSDTRMLDVQIHCLNAKEVVKFGKCGDGWVTAKADPNTCICSQDKSCSSPVQMPGMIWVEVSYSSPYSMECLQLGNKPLLDSRASDFADSNCGGTFVFVGDVISMASSVQLTSYRPRCPYFGAYLPYVLERIFMCTFHVSLTLALLNSLPVYFLDGESVLEVALSHFTSLGSNKRGKVLRMCLLAGTLISFLTFFRIFLKFL